jgi:hypothetical protein
MSLSGAEGGEPIATLALCMGVFDLIQPTNPVRGLYTRSLRKKRKKRRKCSLGDPMSLIGHPD